MKRLLDVVDGVETWHHYDPLTKTTTIETRSDAQVNVDWARSLANDADHWRKGVKKDFAQYAHIPNGVLLQWRTMGVNINNPRELVNMVNRPEWRYLKTTDKVVIVKS